MSAGNEGAGAEMNVEVNVVESSSFTVVRKFDPLSQFAKEYFMMIKEALSFSNTVSAYRDHYEPYSKCFMINALLKHCVSSTDDSVDLKAFMLLYKEAYDEPLFDKDMKYEPNKDGTWEVTVEDVQEYIPMFWMLRGRYQTEYIPKPIDAAVIRYVNSRTWPKDVDPDLIGKEDKPTDPDLIGKEDKPTDPDLIGKEDKPTDPDLIGNEDKPIDPDFIGKEDKPIDLDLIGKEDKPIDPDRIGKEDNPTDVPDDESGSGQEKGSASV